MFLRFTLHFLAILDAALERGAKIVLEKANIMLLIKQASENNQNITTQMIVSANNSSQKVTGKKVWPSFGYFKEQVTDYSMEKVNFPENSLLYINQADATIQKGQKIFYGKHFILRQKIETANVPTDIKSYVHRPEEVKIYRLLYHISIVLRDYVKL